MRSVSLSDYVRDATQEVAGREIGITQGGINRMLKKNREVFLVVDRKGAVVDCYERKKIGRFAACAND